MKKYSESLSSLIKEHKRLVGVLEGGSLKERQKEAQKQGRELKKYIRISKGTMKSK